jgi:SpoVK/Ycf46/Vps4 family AAA+-type ATPase
MYHSKKRKRCNNINLKTLWRIQAPLKKLQELVGLKTVKENMVKQIIYFLQHLENGQDDMLHTIIEGPPGVGKTELGKILGELYVKMGILQNPDINIDDPQFDINKIFKVVKRSDLIGKYLGHTAVKTQEVIDSCKGGVMFIDEAYSLGNTEQKDIFSKECIDTINRNLSEQKANFLCIIAGYPGDMEKCFFAYNDGLKRRFPFKYTIKEYTPDELRDIFKLKVLKLDWSYKDENSILLDFFKENIKAFPHFGGDIETLLLNCKIQHGMRVFSKKANEKKILTFEDVKNGFTAYISVRKNKDDWHDSLTSKMMYL